MILLGGGKTQDDDETDDGIKGMKKKYARKEKEAYEIETTLSGKFETSLVRDIWL